jgi:hypothetical protein
MFFFFLQSAHVATVKSPIGGVISQTALTHHSITDALYLIIGFCILLRVILTVNNDGLI